MRGTVHDNYKIISQGVDMQKKNCIVAQSGGPTVAINASLAGVLQTVIENGAYEKVYGSVNGIMGVLNENVIDLTEKAAEKPEFVERLKKSPSMYLGSCRYRLPDYAKEDAQYAYIFSKLKKYNAGAFFYIGGNDSMDTVDKLSSYAKLIGSDIKIIGIPKTIDNDLVITDHTPGYGSAAKYIASAMVEISHDVSIYPIHSITIVEIMGRDAGWLTAASVLARNSYNMAPHLIYLPEVPFSKEKFISDIKEKLLSHRNIVVAVSEGIRDEKGRYISATSAVGDTFGHSQLSGTGKCLEYIIKENIEVKVRSIEVNILQRCAAHLLSLTDIAESFRAGRHAVEISMDGVSGDMVTIKRTGNNPYSVCMESYPVGEIAGKMKPVPREWISDEGNDVKREFVDYVFPLIQGEPIVEYKNGLPVYLPIEHLMKV